MTETVQYSMQKRAMNQDAKSALLGALIGGGVGGVSSFLTPDDDDESKARKIISHVLAGAAMGSLAGYGVRRLNENTGAIDSIIEAVDPSQKEPPSDWKTLPVRNTLMAAGTTGGAALGYNSIANAVRSRRVSQHAQNFLVPDIPPSGTGKNSVQGHPDSRSLFNGSDNTFNESVLKRIGQKGTVTDEPTLLANGKTLDRAIAESNAANRFSSLPGRVRNRLMSAAVTQYIAESKAGKGVGSFRDWLAQSKFARTGLGKFIHFDSIKDLHLIGDAGINSMIAEVELARDLSHGAAHTKFDNVLTALQRAKGTSDYVTRANAISNARNAFKDYGNVRRMIGSGRNLAKATHGLRGAARRAAVIAALLGGGAYLYGDEQ